MSRNRLPRAILAVAIGVACGGIARADGGTVIASERLDDWQVSLLVSPSIAQAGPVDLSVLVQDAKTGDVVDGADVTLWLESADQVLPTILLKATRKAATNKLYYAAGCQLPAAGRWRIKAEIAKGDTHENLTGFFDVGKPPGQWTGLWKWFAVLAIVVLAFLLRERLVLKQRARRPAKH